MKKEKNLKITTNDPRLNTLSQLCVSKIEDLFNALEVDVTLSGNKYVGFCPIHGDSDNPTALNVYYDGWGVPGYWKCRSKGCEDKFKKNIIGFTRGRLSAMRLNYHWEKNPKAIYGFPGTVDFLCKFVNVDINDIKIDEKELDKIKFINECRNQQNKLYIHNESTIHRSKVKKNLIIPSEYFLNRNYTEDILCKYDVGMARKSKKETENRVIVPIYDDKEYLIGYTCRSVFDKCIKCKSHHDPIENCPINKNLYSKWRHVGFNSEEILYNYWNAKQFIKDTNTAIIVEGPGDVWRLEQYGIKNSVAIFGNTLQDKQERLLANAQCMAIIMLTDSDAAGLRGAEETKRKYGRLYRMYFPNISEHDAGDMNEDAITESIKPILSKLEKVYQ